MAQTASAASVNPSPASSPTSAAISASAKSTDFVQVASSDVLSSNVVGLDIYDNSQNNTLGTIKDVAFDSSKKAVAYIVAVGGVLGVGTRYVAVNPDAVDVSYDTNNKKWRATMAATKEQLTSAPEFKYGGQWSASRS
jgi:sporulation protein YlmC with PRC-barrel domain